MRLARIAAVIVLLQGVMPALAFGFWRPGGFVFLAGAVTYALLAAGVWKSKRSSLLAAIILTIPQLGIVSSALFSWQFFVGCALGIGIAPSSTLLDTRLTTFCSVGLQLDFAFFERSRSLLAGFRHVESETFFLVNLFAVLVLAILVNAFLRCRRAAQHPAAPMTDSNFSE